MSDSSQHPRPANEPAVRKCILAYSSCPSSPPPPPTQPGTKVTFHFRTCLIHELPKSPSSPSSWPHGEHDSLPAIDDSKVSGVPMELLLGKQFKLPVMEQFINSMRVGEVAQFTVPKSLVAAYPFVSQAYRKYVTSVKKRQQARGSHQVSSDEDEQAHTGHHCCGMNLNSGTGHPDLDALMAKPCDLIFVIQLLSVEAGDSYEKEIWQMDDDEKITSIPLLKQQGNDLYREGNFADAAAKYGKALAIIEQLQLKEKPGESEWIAFDTMKVPILSNFAQCKLHLKDFYEAIRHASKVLDLDPNNVKCYFRRAKAHAAVWNLEEARRDLSQVASLDPSMGKTVKIELAKIDLLEAEKRREEATRFTGKLFS